jgi:mono/diheme cytochrome c family protein
LSGGRSFQTPFGTFIAPNISPHPTKGIGRWTTAEFADAMLLGQAPDGRHYYPAFPYPSYTRMTLEDIVDLKAYLDTLPSHARDNEPHRLTFPFSIRRGLGLWKRVFLDDTPVMALDNPDSKLLRGRYLVEGPGHCAECHTPRNILGGFDKTRWLAGAANPDGDGVTPNITPHSTGIAQWDIVDVAEYLSSGFTPEYDVVGSSMAEVVENTAHLSEDDRTAIAHYLRIVPAVEKLKIK